MTDDPLVESVARTLYGRDVDQDEQPWDDREPEMRAAYRQDARAVVASIWATGRLLPGGGETRTEWSAEPSIMPRYVTGPIESDREIVCPMRDPERAMRDYLRDMRAQPALVRRTVYTGPWVTP